MTSFKRITIKDTITGDYLSPKVFGTISYDTPGESETVPPIDTDTLGDHGVEYFAVADHNHDNLYSKLGHTHSISQITGLQTEFDNMDASIVTGKSKLAAILTEKGIDTASDASFETIAENIRKLNVIPPSYDFSNIAVGSTVKWNNDNWICVHQDGDIFYLTLDRIYSMTKFSSNTTATYAGSTLASVAKEYEDSVAVDSLALAIDTTVQNVTAKIFVASYEQMNGGFSYFDSYDSRICKYNGSAQWYWTSSTDYRGFVWGVSGGVGGFASGYGPSALFGFRPSVAIKLPTT